MKIFITLPKYKTRQRHEDGKPLLVVTTLSKYIISIYRTTYSHTSTVQGIFKVSPITGL